MIYSTTRELQIFLCSKMILTLDKLWEHNIQNRCVSILLQNRIFPLEINVCLMGDRSIDCFWIYFFLYKFSYIFWFFTLIAAKRVLEASTDPLLIYYLDQSLESQLPQIMRFKKFLGNLAMLFFFFSKLQQNFLLDHKNEQNKIIFTPMTLK